MPEDTKPEGSAAETESPVVEADASKSESVEEALAKGVSREVAESSKEGGQDQPKGRPSSNELDDKSQEWLKAQAENMAASMYHKLEAKIDEKLQDVAARGSSLTNTDPSDQERNTALSELQALEQRQAAIEMQLKTAEVTQKVQGALVKAKTEHGESFTEDSIKKVLEFVESDQARAMGLGFHTLQAPEGWSAVAFAVGALKAKPEGPQDVHSDTYTMSQSPLGVDKEGKVVRPGGKSDVDVDGLPLEQRLVIKTNQAVDKIGKQ